MRVKPISLDRGRKLIRLVVRIFLPDRKLNVGGEPAQRVADRVKELCGIEATTGAFEAPRPADVAE
jgi:hypothetical protein